MNTTVLKSGKNIIFDSSKNADAIQRIKLLREYNELKRQLTAPIIIDRTNQVLVNTSRNQSTSQEPDAISLKDKPIEQIAFNFQSSIQEKLECVVTLKKGTQIITSTHMGLNYITNDYGIVLNLLQSPTVKDLNKLSLDIEIVSTSLSVNATFRFTPRLYFFVTEGETFQFDIPRITEKYVGKNFSIDINHVVLLQENF